MNDSVTIRASLECVAGLDWKLFQESFAAGIALWQDLDGVHLEPLPEECPLTSFLWAASTDGRTMARIRLDPNSDVQVIAGAKLWLVEPPAGCEIVTVRKFEQVTGWGTDEQRVSEQAGMISSGDWTAYETIEPSPLMFVQLTRA